MALSVCVLEEQTKKARLMFLQPESLCRSCVQTKSAGKKRLKAAIGRGNGIVISVM